MRFDSVLEQSQHTASLIQTEIIPDPWKSHVLLFLDPMISPEAKINRCYLNNGIKKSLITGMG